MVSEQFPADGTVILMANEAGDVPVRTTWFAERHAVYAVEKQVEYGKIVPSALRGAMVGSAIETVPQSSGGAGAAVAWGVAVEDA